MIFGFSGSLKIKNRSILERFLAFDYFSGCLKRLFIVFSHRMCRKCRF
ncbi:MAG: hypothetical protein J6U05_04630 [Neisseriaceae bacterium]|nr:hypothetical protein [Neisseriaceae bacterium]